MHCISNCTYKKTRPLTHFDIALDTLGEALSKAMASELFVGTVSGAVIEDCVLRVCQLLCLGNVKVTLNKKGKTVEQDAKRPIDPSTHRPYDHTICECCSCCFVALHLFVCTSLLEEYTRMDKLTESLAAVIQASFW